MTAASRARPLTKIEAIATAALKRTKDLNCVTAFQEIIAIAQPQHAGRGGLPTRKQKSAQKKATAARKARA